MLAQTMDMEEDDYEKFLLAEIESADNEQNLAQIRNRNESESGSESGSESRSESDSDSDMDFNLLQLAQQQQELNYMNAVSTINAA